MMAMSEDSETIGDQLGKQKCVIQVKRDEDPVLANHGKNLKEEERARGKEGMLETAKTYCETKKSWGRSKSQTDSEQYLDHRDIYRDDGKERKLQQKVESLQEQLRVKNSEIEDLTTRYSCIIMNGVFVFFCPLLKFGIHRLFNKCVPVLIIG